MGQVDAANPQLKGSPPSAAEHVLGCLERSGPDMDTGRPAPLVVPDDWVLVIVASRHHGIMHYLDPNYRAQ